jgi:hypothetical protein
VRLNRAIEEEVDLSSALARTARPAADQELAGAVQSAPASNPKPDSFPATHALYRKLS